MPSRRHLPLVFSVAILLLLAAALSPAGRQIDRSITAKVIQHRADWPALTTVFRIATRFGNPPIAPCAAAFVAVALVILARSGTGGVKIAELRLWLIAIVGGWFLSNALKAVVRRARPPLAHRLVAESNYSFPSTHSVFAAAFFTMLAILLVRHLPEQRPGWKAFAVASCGILALSVGVSRIWLGVHYPTDVLGGLILGSGWSGLVIWLDRRWNPDLRE